MNVAVGLQTSARIYFEFAFTIWAMINMGESFAIVVGSWIAVEGLTVTCVEAQREDISAFADSPAESSPLSCRWLGRSAVSFPCPCQIGLRRYVPSCCRKTQR